MGEKIANRILDKPNDINYLSKPYRDRGVRTTLPFVSKGGTIDFFTIFDNAGLNSDVFGFGDFKKLPNGDVAAIFSDLFGRIDDAMRPIPHAVLIPAEKAVGVDSIEDVIEKFAPRMEEMYQRYVENRRTSG